MTNDLAQLDVFYGDLTVARAYIYARLPRLADDAGLSLAGQVRGPRCLHAQTLPLSSPLVDLGPGPTLLSQALVPDPCFWSPDLPAIYDVTVNLLRGKEVIATARREIGLRSLGVRGRYFALESKRWVLRGVRAASTTATMPRERHEAAAAYVVGAASEEQLAEASQWGAMAVVEVSGANQELVARLRTLALHPCVAMAIVRGELPADFKHFQVAPNLLLAQSFGQNDEINLQPWAQVMLVAAEDPALVERIAAVGDLPLIAVRPLINPLPIAEARAACDALQRDLAPIGQFAGYVV
jgi:hypothetical protein